jgi:hypothetical protein
LDFQTHGPEVKISVLLGSLDLNYSPIVKAMGPDDILQGVLNGPYLCIQRIQKKRVNVIP